jgi:hypothetical protein
VKNQNLAFAAALVLRHVHDGVRPDGLAGLQELAAATQALKAAGTDPLDPVALALLTLGAELGGRQ